MGMRIFAGLIGLGVISLAGSTAFAADLAQPPAASPSAFNWTGNYLGLEGGYGWANSTYSVPSNGFSVSPNPRGALGGIFNGYNYEFVNHVVVGLDSDVDISSIGASNVGIGSTFTPVSARETWSTTGRARLGYAFDRFLPYIAVGGVFANFNHSTYDARVSNSGVSWSAIRSGMTVGGGLDYAITDRIVARIEYRYDDFGSMSYLATGSGVGPIYSAHKVSLNSSDIRFGLGYKLDDEDITAPTKIANAAVHNWAGYYVGADGGYNWGTSSYNAPTTNFSAGLNSRGGLIGAFGGNNYQFSNNFVAGFEGDYDFTNSKVSNAFGSALGVPNTANSHGEEIDWTSSTRARLGYAYGSVLPFVTAGVAFEQDKVTDQTLAVANSAVSWSEIRIGYTAGAGLEYALTDKISARVEYRFADFGKNNFPTNYADISGHQYAPHSVSLETNDIRAGISYKLN